MMSINYSVIGTTESDWDNSDVKRLTDSNGTELDVSTEIQRIVSLVPAGTRIKVTIETVDA